MGNALAKAQTVTYPPQARSYGCGRRRRVSHRGIPTPLIGLLLLGVAAIGCGAGHAQASAITLTVDPSVAADFATIGAAVATEVAGNTYTVNVAPGNYTNDFAVFNAATVVNASGVTDSTNMPPPNDKGVFTTVNPLTVNGLTFTATPDTGPNSLGSGIGAALGYNSSAIREQANGPNTLTLNGVTISNFQMGVLTASNTGSTYQDVVSISNSKFFNNGFPNDPADPAAFGHAIYVGDAAALDVSNTMVCGQQVGHDIKSRAASTTVTSSSLFVGTNAGAPAGCGVGSASLAIDVPNGGVAQVINDQLFQGTANQNGALIAFGEEGLKQTTNSLAVSGTVFNGDGVGSIGINEFGGCAGPITETNDTFNNVTTPVNASSGCVTTGTTTGTSTTATVAAVPEPSALAVFGSSLILLLLGRGWLSRREPRGRGTNLTL